MSDQMILDHCAEHAECEAVLIFERDGVEEWRSHLLPCDPPVPLIARLNLSYDTFDRRDGTVLRKEDAAAQAAESAGADGVLGTSDDTASRSWWRFWSR